MTEQKTSTERSRNMAAIKGKNTKPEITVRKFLFSKGLRYRIHVSNLPGRPDIVLPKYKTVVFVDGCFWHGHDGCKYFRLPKTNIQFWKDKIDRNISRDARDTETLHKLGWRVFRVWECNIRTISERADYLQLLYDQIIHRTPAIYSLESQSHPLTTAAEPNPKNSYEPKNSLKNHGNIYCPDME
ncbi:MAG: very short patch repair endonuclease [Duncaniella sp.]|nr:very short patch repair endonuclease [Duncaniella sp.]